MKRSLAISIALICAATTSHAGIFGPSNYDECLLDGAKSAQTEAAVQLVIAACRSKFPPNNASNQNEPEKSYRLFSALKADRPGVNNVINKISIVRAKSSRNKVQLTATNRNWFSVEGVSIGIPKKRISSCSWNQEDYAEFYDCSGHVGPQQTGVMDCEIPDASSRQLSYCVVGFFIYATEAEANTLKKRENIPPLK